MSAKLLGTVFGLGIPTSQKIVLLAMADHARDDGAGCYPSVSLLAKKTSMTRRGVQKVMVALKASGFIRPVRLRGDGVFEYQVIVEGGEPRSQGGANGIRRGEPRSLRTRVHEGGEYGSHEPKDEPKSYKRPSKSQKADPRFQEIVSRYFDRSRGKGIEPTFDKTDAGALANWLKANPAVSTEKILGWLENAFDSTDPYPLRRGFRLREFISHNGKYQLGPLVKGGSTVPGHEPETAQVSL